MLEVGTVAPDFTLQDQNGEEHSLSDYRGKKVILYFYPKDNTAGCTKQACGFAELYPQFTEKGYGIPFISSGKKIVKIGANFSTELRTLDDWKVEKSC